MIRLSNVTKYYNNNGVVATGISRVNLKLDVGEYVVITGESGSGKSTLLNVISGLDTYEEGEVYINNLETSHYTEKDFEDYRRKYVSNIYQSFNLINSYTVYQNIELVLLLNGYNKKEIKEKIHNIISQVNMKKYTNTLVSKLSGGQKQRVAIARALATETNIIIDDEPTGNLDSKQALEVLEILYELSKTKLVVVVTHNYEQFKAYATRKIIMSDGFILEDKKIKSYDKQEVLVNDFEKIKFFSVVNLFLRNTFNVFPKFILLLFVFLFVSSALMGQYASIKHQEEEAQALGVNYYFKTDNLNRIVIGKDNISENDIDKIKGLDEVSSVVLYDFILESHVFINFGFENIFGRFDVVSNLTEVQYGKEPSSEDEILIELPAYNYDSNDVDRFLNQTINVVPYEGNLFEFKVVGVNIVDSYENNFYIHDDAVKEVAALKFVFENDLFYKENNGEPKQLDVIVSTKALEGMIHVSDGFCTECIGEEVTINKYDYSKNFMVNEFDESLIDGKSFENNSKSLYVIMHPLDYLEFYYPAHTQMSVYANSIDEVDSLEASLKELGYNTLAIKNSLVNHGMESFVLIFYNIITFILIVTLFFISYFVIRIIMKSRNIYFSTIRMLGANKKTALNLLIGELWLVATLGYLILVLLVLSPIDFSFFDIIRENLDLSYYIFVYFIITILSYLISLRYSSKLFKKSAISTINEEV